jgi:hypothetical protein
MWISNSFVEKIGIYFSYLAVSEAKVKERILIGPLIRQAVHGPDFRSTLSCTEKAAWNTFKSVCTNCIGIHWSESYREIVS